VLNRVLKKRTTKELAKNTFVVDKKIDIVVNNLEDEIHQFERQLDHYGSKIEVKCFGLTKQQEAYQKELAELEHYRSAHFLTKVNEKLTQDLQEINQYLKGILEIVQTKPTSYLPKPALGNNPNSQEEINIGESFLQQMQQCDLFFKFIKSKLILN